MSDRGDPGRGEPTETNVYELGVRDRWRLICSTFEPSIKSAVSTGSDDAWRLQSFIIRLLMYKCSPSMVSPEMETRRWLFGNLEIITGVGRWINCQWTSNDNDKSTKWTTVVDRIIGHWTWLEANDFETYITMDVLWLATFNKFSVCNKSKEKLTEKFLQNGPALLIPSSCTTEAWKPLIDFRQSSCWFAVCIENKTPGYYRDIFRLSTLLTSRERSSRRRP